MRKKETRKEECIPKLRCDPIPFLYPVNVNLKMQPNWKISNYDELNQIPIPSCKTPISLMNYTYQSDMANNSEIFKLPDPEPSWPESYKGYSDHITSINYFKVSTSNPIKTPGNLTPTQGVPGPFDYNMDWSHWGGDDILGIGKLFYTNILAHFGHTHTLSVHSAICSKLNNPASVVTSQVDMMDHLLDGSTQIFRWYAQLVGVDGNAINYMDPAVSTPNPPFNPYFNTGFVPSVKGFMDMYITGAGTKEPSCCGDQDMDPCLIIGFLSQFKDLLGGAPIVGDKVTTIVDFAIPFLTKLLRRNVDQSNPIAYSSWYYLMKNHQMLVDRVYDLCRELYLTDPCDPCYCDRLEAANKVIYSALDTGRQMAAFFSIFYTATALLDLLVTSTGDASEPVIPLDYVVERVSFIAQAQQRWWYEHVNMFVDYDRAAAVNDQQSMYKIQLTMLESCTFIACTVGEVFRAWDTLVRNRNLFGILSGIQPPPPQPSRMLRENKINYLLNLTYN